MKKLIFIMAIISFYSFHSGSEYKVYEGIAKDKNSMEFIYQEIHKEIFMEGKHIQTITSFHENDGKEFARRELDFRNSFEKPNYHLVDKRNGLLEEVKHLGDNLFHIRYRANATAKLRAKKIHIPEPAIIDGGFNYYIKNNWDNLVRGEKLIFNFLSVPLQDYFTFRIYKVPNEKDNSSIMRLKMECKKFIFRALLSPIYVHYDLESKRIVKYEGISNIRDIKGSSYKALLQYPELGP